MSKRVNPHIRLITMGLLLVVWSSTTVAETIFVDANSPPAGDGNSWPTAYNYLQDGLADAVSGDEIRVANGTYRPDQSATAPGGTNSTYATFELIDGVGLYGGYAGFGAPDPNHRDVQQYETTLTGTLNTKNSLHVVNGTGTSATAVINGFTITGGNAVNTSGGGMLNNPGSPTVVNCLFQGNSTTAYGGGMYNRISSPTLIDCTFTGNSANNNGGGIYNSNSSPEITNCTFTTNSSQQDGGGICNYSGSNPELTNCLFTGNSAAGRGGGIYNYNSSNPDMVNCIFTGNSSTDHGGGTCNWSSSPKLFGCLFNCNSTAMDGGGMYNYSGNPTLTNCTFSANVADGNGGGIFNDLANPIVTNCIFWANDDSGVPIAPAQIQGGSPDIMYTCIQDDDPNDSLVPFECPDCNNIDDDPMFVRDPNNGADGWGDDPCTPGVDEGANDDYGDLHLLTGSPCIDSGINSATPPDANDLDGGARITDGNGDGIAVVNMGVYESVVKATEDIPEGIPGDIDLDGDVDLADFAILSYQWLGAPGDPSADIAPPGGDGTVDGDDLLVVAANWLLGTPGIPGDIDLDGDVDLVDFVILSNQWQDVPGDPSADIAPPGGDGEVNSDDLLIVAANWLAGT